MKLRNGYADWVNSDCGSGFAEFMGFTPPKLEEQKIDGRVVCRYVKDQVKGDWCANKTRAYTSYREVRKARRTAITKLRAEMREQAKSLTPAEVDLLQRVTGARGPKRIRDYATNFYTTPAQGPEFDFAMTLVEKGLMGVGTREDARRYFEVTPKGCRMVGVPESIIEDYRYSTGWYE
jgi:hypothetical protein